MSEEKELPYTPQILNILVWPDELLTLECDEVTEFDVELREFVADMFSTMKSFNGVGLSAPQVGRQKQIITLSIEEDKPLVLINPEVEVIDDTPYEWEEGCLSVPGYFKKKERPLSIAVDYRDVTGEPHSVEFQKLYAFAIQHEVDHLGGKCFVDSLPVWRKELVKRKIKKSLPHILQEAGVAQQMLRDKGVIV